MVSRLFLIRLIWATFALAVAVAVVSGVSLLLGQMNDFSGALGMRIFAMVLGIAWFVNLVVLVLALAINAVTLPQDSSVDVLSDSEDDEASS